jgi:hypothetical protein
MTDIISKETIISNMTRELARLREENKRLGNALSKAAMEINCAGPVDHRIRVLRDALSTEIDNLKKENAIDWQKGFSVIDNETNELADIAQIALDEEWAKELMYCDMEGFAIEEDGTLNLLDECGAYACCPIGRFKIVPKE